MLPLTGLTGAGAMGMMEHYANQLSKWKDYLYGGGAARADAAEMAISGMPTHGRSRQAMLLKNFTGKK